MAPISSQRQLQSPMCFLLSWFLSLALAFLLFLGGSLRASLLRAPPFETTRRSARARRASQPLGLQSPRNLGGAEITDDEWKNTAACTRVMRLVADGKTRMWSIVDMAMTILSQREANRRYGESGEADGFEDLTEAEYKRLQLFVGPSLSVADLEKFLEGEGYNTLSVARYCCFKVATRRGYFPSTICGCHDGAAAAPSHTIADIRIRA